LLKITNISNKPIKLQVEFGDSNSSQMRIPGIVLFIGVILMIIASYQKLRNYNMAQPDEKIS
jgi:predicted histidine transporter YuiF (NhaC family)